MAETENTSSSASSEESPAESRRASTRRSSSENDPTKRTPGVSEDAKAVDSAADLPLNVGPRDALIVDGHNEVDYVPDVDGKGYHVGLIRQPVMALVENGVIVGYEAVDESKFAGVGSLASLKEKHNADEKKWKEGRDYRAAAPEPTA